MLQSKGGILSKACDYIKELRQSNLKLGEDIGTLDRLKIDNQLLRQEVHASYVKVLENVEHYYGSNGYYLHCCLCSGGRLEVQEPDPEEPSKAARHCGSIKH